MRVKSKVKIIHNHNERYDYVMGYPWIQNDYITGESLTFRIQELNLEKCAYKLWVTNGVYQDVIFVDFKFLKDFIRTEENIGHSLFLDDSGVGLENLKY